MTSHPTHYAMTYYIQVSYPQEKKGGENKLNTQENSLTSAIEPLWYNNRNNHEELAIDLKVKPRFIEQYPPTALEDHGRARAVQGKVNFYSF